jgi:hypothetical protein
MSVLIQRYEAPVYQPYNSDGTHNASAGHASTALYTGNDIERKVFDVLPDELKEVDTFPDETVYYITNAFIQIIAELQLAYQFYLNETHALRLTTAQQRGFKTSASNMRVQAVVRQTQELFYPLTYDIIEPHIVEHNMEAITDWVQKIKSRANVALGRIAQNFCHTFDGVPSPPEGYYVGEDAEHYETFAQGENSHDYAPVGIISLNAL